MQTSSGSFIPTSKVPCLYLGGSGARQRGGATRRYSHRVAPLVQSGVSHSGGSARKKINVAVFHASLLPNAIFRRRDGGCSFRKIGTDASPKACAFRHHGNHSVASRNLKL